MKKLLFLILLVPSKSFARFGMSLHGGFNAGAGSNAEFNNSRLQTFMYDNKSFSASLRCFISIKHFDFGLGIERGGFHSAGKITKEDQPVHEHYAISGLKVYNSMVYTTPFLYANYKFKLAGPVYLFAGLSAGNTFIGKGSGTITLSERVGNQSYIYYFSLSPRRDVNITTGIQGGAFVRINKDLSIFFEVASRNIIISGLTSGQTGAQIYTPGSELINREVTQSVYYFPVNLGIRYKF